MTQKRWSTTEVSAYLDEALDPRDRVAFEAQMTTDPALQRRVDEMQQVVALVQAMPLRQSPRNYLLSPAMVAERKPQPKTQQMPLMMMRLATSLVALAFVITFGLNVLQSSLLFRGEMMPAMAPQSADLPEAAMVSLESLPAEDAVQPEEEALRALKADAPEVLATRTIEEPAALEAPRLPEELAARVAEGEVLGMGEAMTDTQLEESAEIELAAAAVPPEEAIEEEAAVAETVALSEEVVVEPASEGGARAVDAEEEQRIVGTHRPTIRPLLWITIGLGIATAALTAITVWLSRRQVG